MPPRREEDEGMGKSSWDRFWGSEAARKSKLNVVKGIWWSGVAREVSVINNIQLCSL